MRSFGRWIGLCIVAPLCFALYVERIEAAVAGVLVSPYPRHPEQQPRDEPPVVTLRSEDTKQAGRLVSSCWISGTAEEGFTETCGDGALEFPRPKRHAAGPLKFFINLGRHDAPVDVSLDGWRLGSNRRPAGPSVPIPHTLERPSDTRSNYKVHVTDFLAASFFLQLGVTWNDQEGGGSESGTWTFYLRTPE